MSRTILVVDDDALLRRSLAYNLERAGYTAHTFASAEDALDFVRHTPPDLVLLDISLPGMDGLDAIKTLKAQLPVPVIFLTARRRELDEVVGLELGADDYVTKPFDFDVLLAHIKAVLRRFAGPAASQQPQANPISADDLYIDPGAHLVRCAGQPVELSPREFDLLFLLASRLGKVVSTQDILNQVWGAEFMGEPQVVYVHVRWLREKLEADPNHPRRILTVRGVGYRLVPQPESEV